MNRSELVDSVAAQAGLDKIQAEKAVKAVVDIVMLESKAGGKVSIFGFGAFTPTSRAARIGRNPQTGEAVSIAASNGVKFSPSTAFKALLNPPKPVAKKASKAGAAKKAAASAPVATKKAAPAKKAAEKASKSGKKAAKSAKKK